MSLINKTRNSVGRYGEKETHLLSVGMLSGSASLGKHCGDYSKILLDPPYVIPPLGLYRQREKHEFKLYMYTYIHCCDK